MSSSEELHETRSSRRGLLGLAGAALVGVLGGSLGRTADARGADGGSVVIGGTNVSGGAATTKLSATGSIPDGGALTVEGPNAQSGVRASGRDIGVHGSGPIGLYGEGAVGGVFSGTDAALSLTPAAIAGPPTGVAVKGDVMVDSAGVLHLCIADGTPGTWIPVSHGSTRYLASPNRIYDSRNHGAPFAGGSTHTIPITSAGAGIPVDARGILCNVTVTSTSDLGFLTIFPAGEPRPDPSNVNWSAGQTIANFAAVRLGDGGQVSIYIERSNAHVIVDVTGYMV